MDIYIVTLSHLKLLYYAMHVGNTVAYHDTASLLSTISAVIVRY